ncbi:hypothetical protein [Marinobacter subterrani]|uniref:Uncharacterized protein n=1 Tax=Marinobacter subterrani TaxID=1658765 RepID=A0A0J7JB17_9GAMM|nr:hypothetical protein [Marinobacter subterrani]KMQ73756.1 hypothetical protein Msub_20977 [Marinobacter subterrani]KMQ75362.1 hypothetical protein Msub_11564 [Marinobacter subterrani]KMQ76984.1 hypothetical protein Msub_13199 [Marinobacter subterrani]
MAKGTDFDIEEMQRTRAENMRTAAAGVWHSYFGQCVEKLMMKGRPVTKEAVIAELQAEIEGRPENSDARIIAETVLRKVESITSDPS